MKSRVARYDPWFTHTGSDNLQISIIIRIQNVLPVIVYLSEKNHFVADVELSWTNLLPIIKGRCGAAVTDEELKYLSDLYINVEFGFYCGRMMDYLRRACVDGENGFPQMSLDDYIQYEKRKYMRWSFLTVKEVVDDIYTDVIRYYGDLKNNPDVQREIRRRINKAIIDDLINVQCNLAPEIKKIYDVPRYVITPFSKNRLSFQESSNAESQKH